MKVMFPSNIPLLVALLATRHDLEHLIACVMRFSEVLSKRLGQRLHLIVQRPTGRGRHQDQAAGPRYLPTLVVSQAVTAELDYDLGFTFQMSLVAKRCDPFLDSLAMGRCESGSAAML